MKLARSIAHRSVQSSEPRCHLNARSGMNEFSFWREIQLSGMIRQILSSEKVSKERREHESFGYSVSDCIRGVWLSQSKLVPKFPLKDCDEGKLFLIDARVA